MATSNQDEELKRILASAGIVLPDDETTGLSEQNRQELAALKEIETGQPQLGPPDSDAKLNEILASAGISRGEDEKLDAILASAGVTARPSGPGPSTAEAFVLGVAESADPFGLRKFGRRKIIEAGPQAPGEPEQPLRMTAGSVSRFMPPAEILSPQQRYERAVLSEEQAAEAAETSPIAFGTGAGVGGLASSLPTFAYGTAGIQSLKWFQTLNATRPILSTSIAQGLVSGAMNAVDMGEQRGLWERLKGGVIAGGEMGVLAAFMHPFARLPFRKPAAGVPAGMPARMGEAMLKGSIPDLSYPQALMRVGAWSLIRSGMAAAGVPGIADTTTAPAPWTGIPTIDNMIWDIGTQLAMHRRFKPKEGDVIPMAVEAPIIDHGQIVTKPVFTSGTVTKVSKEGRRIVYKMKLPNGQFVDWELGRLPKIYTKEEGPNPVRHEVNVGGISFTEGDLIAITGSDGTVNEMGVFQEFHQVPGEEPTAIVNVLHPETGQSTVEFRRFRGLRKADGPEYESWLKGLVAASDPATGIEVIDSAINNFLSLSRSGADDATIAQANAVLQESTTLAIRAGGPLPEDLATKVAIAIKKTVDMHFGKLSLKRLVDNMTMDNQAKIAQSVQPDPTDPAAVEWLRRGAVPANLKESAELHAELEVLNAEDAAAAAADDTGEFYGAVGTVPPIEAGEPQPFLYDWQGESVARGQADYHSAEVQTNRNMIRAVHNHLKKLFTRGSIDPLDDSAYPTVAAYNKFFMDEGLKENTDDVVATKIAQQIPIEVMRRIRNDIEGFLDKSPGQHAASGAPIIVSMYRAVIGSGKAIKERINQRELLIRSWGYDEHPIIVPGKENYHVGRPPGLTYEGLHPRAKTATGKPVRVYAATADHLEYAVDLVSYVWDRLPSEIRENVFPRQFYFMDDPLVPQSKSDWSGKYSYVEGSMYLRINRTYGRTDKVKKRPPYFVTGETYKDDPKGRMAAALLYTTLHEFGHATLNSMTMDQVNRIAARLGWEPDDGTKTGPEWVRSPYFEVYTPSNKRGGKYGVGRVQTFRRRLSKTDLAEVRLTHRGAIRDVNSLSKNSRIYNLHEHVAEIFAKTLSNPEWMQKHYPEEFAVIMEEVFKGVPPTQIKEPVRNEKVLAPYAQKSQKQLSKEPITVKELEIILRALGAQMRQEASQTRGSAPSEEEPVASGKKKKKRDMASYLITTEEEALPRMKAALDTIVANFPDDIQDQIRDNILKEVSGAVDQALAYMRGAGKFHLNEAIALTSGITGVFERIAESKNINKWARAEAKDLLGAAKAVLRNVNSAASGTPFAKAPSQATQIKSAAVITGEGQEGASATSAIDAEDVDVSTQKEPTQKRPTVRISSIDQKLMNHGRGTPEHAKMMVDLYGTIQDKRVIEALQKMTATRHDGSIDVSILTSFEGNPMPMKEALAAAGITEKEFRAQVKVDRQTGEITYHTPTPGAAPAGNSTIRRLSTEEKAAQQAAREAKKAERLAQQAAAKAKRLEQQQQREAARLAKAEASAYDEDAKRAKAKADSMNFVNRLLKIHDETWEALNRNPHDKTLQRKMAEVYQTMYGLTQKSAYMSKEQREMVLARGMNVDAVQDQILDFTKPPLPTASEWVPRYGPSTPLSASRQLLIERKNLKVALLPERSAKMDPLVRAQLEDRLGAIEKKMLAMGIEPPPEVPLPTVPPSSDPEAKTPEQPPPGSKPPNVPPPSKKPKPVGLFTIETVPEFQTEALREAGRRADLTPVRVIIRGNDGSIYATYTTKKAGKDYPYQDRYDVQPVGYMKKDGTMLVDPQAIPPKDFEDTARQHWKGGEFRWRLVDTESGKVHGPFSSDGVRHFLRGQWLPGVNYDPTTGKVLSSPREIAALLASQGKNQPVEVKHGTAALSEAEFGLMTGPQQMGHIMALVDSATSKEGAYKAYFKFIGNVTVYPNANQDHLNLVRTLNSKWGTPDKVWEGRDREISQAIHKIAFAEKMFGLRAAADYIRPDIEGGTGKAYDMSLQTREKVQRAIVELIKNDVEEQPLLDLMALDINGTLPLVDQVGLVGPTNSAIRYMHPIMTALVGRSRLTYEHMNNLVDTVGAKLVNVFKDLTIPQQIAVARLTEGRYQAGEQLDVLKSAIMKGRRDVVNFLTGDMKLLYNGIKEFVQGRPDYEKLFVAEATDDLKARARELRAILNEMADIAGLERNQRIIDYFPHFFKKIKDPLRPEYDAVFELPDGMTVPGEVFFRHFMKRSADLGGYEAMPLAVMQTYLKGWARKVAFDPLLAEFTDPHVMNALPPSQRKYAREYMRYLIGARRDTTNTALASALGALGLRMPDVPLLRGLRSWMLQQGGGDPAYRLASFLRGWQFVAALGYNTAFIATNLAQAPITLIRYGPRRYFHDFYQALRRNSPGRKLFDDLHIAGDVKRSDIGLLTGTPNTLGRAFLAGASAVFQASEVLNSRQAFQSGWRYLKESGMSNPDAILGGILEKDLTQINTTATGKPPLLRGTLGGTVMQMSQYKFEMLRLIGQQYMDAFSKDPVIRNRAFKRLFLTGATLHALGGLRAVPFGPAVTALMLKAAEHGLLPGEDDEWIQMWAALDRISLDDALGRYVGETGEPYEIGSKINPFDLASNLGVGPTLNKVAEFADAMTGATYGFADPTTGSLQQMIVRNLPAGQQLSITGATEINAFLERMGIEGKLKEHDTLVGQVFGSSPESAKKLSRDIGNR